MAEVPLKKGIGGPVIGKARTEETDQGIEVTIFDLTPEGRELFSDSYTKLSLESDLSLGNNVFDYAEVEPEDEPVHKRHFQDGFPLCWDQHQDGTYKATSKEAEVTCPECINYMKD